MGLEERKKSTSLLNAGTVDIAFLGFLAFLVVRYWQYISEMQVPMWDGVVYLANASNWLSGSSLFEIYRPPLISWLIAAVWLITGQNWVYVKPLAAVLSVGSGIILYLTLRRRKGALFSLGVTALTMLNAQVFFYSSQIYTEGVSLFFIVATLYFLKSEKPTSWFLAGTMMAMAFASRYPTIFQCVVIFVVESFIRKNLRLVSRAILGAVPVILGVIFTVYLKTGTFQAGLSKDMSFGFPLSVFYLANSIDIWGLVFLLVPAAFLFRRTYSDSYNYSFIAWFIMSLLFWSSNITNQQERFAIGFTPAVNYLALLTIENLAKLTLKNGPMFGLAMRIAPGGRLDTKRYSSLRPFGNNEEPVKRSNPTNVMPEGYHAAALPPSVSCGKCGRRIARDHRYCDGCGSPVRLQKPDSLKSQSV